MNCRSEVATSLQRSPETAAAYSASSVSSSPRLDNAIKALQAPDVGNYINGKYAARGKTVGELVKNMGGLKFAQATPGDEQAYKALQEKLASYYNRSQPSTRSE